MWKRVLVLQFIVQSRFSSKCCYDAAQSKSCPKTLLAVKFGSYFSSVPRDSDCQMKAVQCQRHSQKRGKFRGLRLLNVVICVAYFVPSAHLSSHLTSTTYQGTSIQSKQETSPFKPKGTTKQHRFLALESNFRA